MTLDGIQDEPPLNAEAETAPASAAAGQGVEVPTKTTVHGSSTPAVTFPLQVTHHLQQDPVSSVDHSHRTLEESHQQFNSIDVCTTADHHDSLNVPVLLSPPESAASSVSSTSAVVLSFEHLGPKRRRVLSTTVQDEPHTTTPPTSNRHRRRDSAARRATGALNDGVVAAAIHAATVQTAAEQIIVRATPDDRDSAIGNSPRHAHPQPDTHNTSQPPTKRQRTLAMANTTTPSREEPPRSIDLSSTAFTKPAIPPSSHQNPYYDGGLTSPLFFSASPASAPSTSSNIHHHHHHHHSRRPGSTSTVAGNGGPSALARGGGGRGRPHSFSNGLEAAGAMLNRLREGSDVTTLKLARGTVSAATTGIATAVSPSARTNTTTTTSIGGVLAGGLPGSTSGFGGTGTPGSNWSNSVGDGAACGGGPVARNTSPSDTQSSTPILGDATVPGGCGSGGLLQLQNVGMLELLDRDDRPTFIVDGANPSNSTISVNDESAGGDENVPSLAILYANPAFGLSTSARHLVPGDHGRNNAMVTGAEGVDDGTKSVGSEEIQGFTQWVKNAGSNHPDGQRGAIYSPSYRYGGLDWTCTVLRNRFRVVSANISAASEINTRATASPEPMLDGGSSSDVQTRILTPMAANLEPGEASLPKTPSDIDLPDRDYFGDVDAVTTVQCDDVPIYAVPPTAEESMRMMMMQQQGQNDGALTPEMAIIDTPQPSFDWTRLPLTSDLPAHIRFAREKVDWASTPLGPIEHWSSDLRAMANMVMGSPHPAALYWGPEFTTIYNEAYITMAGAKHPSLMGSSYKEAWPDIWPDMKQIFEGAWESGQATMKNDDRIIMNRNGFPEETFFSWSIVPLVGASGSVVGLYNPAFEHTRRKVAERRMLTLREIGQTTGLARDVRGFWGLVNKGLEYNDEDLPFALVYSVAEESEGQTTSMHTGSLENLPWLQLEAYLGVPAGHRCLVQDLDLRSTNNEGFAPHMRECMARSGAPVTLSEDDGTMPPGLMDFVGNNHSEPCRHVVIFPIHPTTGGEKVVGFIVLGINPRRPYDDDYQLFVHLLSRQLATSLASVVLFEEEIRRGQKAARLAALDRQELTEQLRDRTREVKESELKFTRMAQFAPVGMFIADHAGQITYCNDMWWEMSRHPKTVDSVHTWMESVEDEDLPGLRDVWAQLIREKVAITHEFRFKRLRRREGEPDVDTWVLLSAHPETEPGHGIKSIFGCITNITQQKQAEQIQVQRREEAVVLKRQQENFIDITSHEMRNPLSAILQCADEISGTLAKYNSDEEGEGKQGAGTSGTSQNGGNISAGVRVAMEACLEAASTITLCASHQKRIVDDILTLSKLDSQLLLVTPVDVQPTAVVQRVLKMFEGELNANRIELEFKVKNRYIDLGVDWVKLDPSRLLQVLINLMTNAIKFTQGRPQRKIYVTLDATRDTAEAAAQDDGNGVAFFPSDRPDRDDITEEPDWGMGDKVNLHFSVLDTGRGLAEHEKKMLFQRFSQASPRTHVQYGGSGLGLFISRILTELQGGQIGAVSQEGLGSTFSFYIQSRKTSPPPPETRPPGPSAPPLTRSSGSSTIIENRQPKPSPATMMEPPNGGQATTNNAKLLSVKLQQPSLLTNATATRPLRKTASDGTPFFDVLIVEDNVVNQRVLQRQLRNTGNKTLVANHGGEALERIRSSRFWRGIPPGSGEDISVILMDLEMPIMDGMTCARKIRELEAAGNIVRHIPIIAVTAYARPEQIEDAKAAGIDDVISKPFRMPELIPRIEQLVERWDLCCSTEPTAV